MKRCTLRASRLIIFLLVLTGIPFGNTVFARSTHIIVDSLTTVIDAEHPPFDSVKPGDTLFLSGGRRSFLLIRNFTGAPGAPVVMVNYNGVVTIDTDHYFGISVENCRYIHLTGSGSEDNFYGIQVTRVAQGGGIGIGKLSSDVELDHCLVKNVLFGAIYAKTDPDCQFNSTREKFTQYNTLIHDNYIENTGYEGMYIGSSKYFGQVVNCSGKDTLLFPSLLYGVRIYRNILTSTAWDGIQVSSASGDCQISDNVVMYDSQGEVFGQMSGILIGGGSRCDCFNNYIWRGKGTGIESHGMGGYRIYNNIIEDAGLGYAPDDLNKMKYGIFVSDVSVQPGSSFQILNNDIVHPKSDGIRFLSTLSKNNLVASNAIINPGNYDFYENGGFNVKGIDAYVMIPDSSADVNLLNNYFARTADGAGFAPASFSLLPGSPLIDAGHPGSPVVTFDFYGHARPYGPGPDIGATEFNPAYLGTHQPADNGAASVRIYPVPVVSTLTIGFNLEKRSPVELDLYDIRGNLAGRVHYGEMEKGTRTLTHQAADLPDGIYLYVLRAGGQNISGRFLKAGR